MIIHHISGEQDQTDKKQHEKEHANESQTDAGSKDFNEARSGGRAVGWKVSLAARFRTGGHNGFTFRDYDRVFILC